MVITGELISDRGQHIYPIVRGVPRFLQSEGYTDSFGIEWKRWSRIQFEAENRGRPLEGHTTRMFETITRFSGTDLANKLVLEFGCGGGRFLDVVRSKGGIAVGIDMSEAVEPARENFENDPDVLIVQGDVLNPPFKSSTFDFGYSIGVLHHTPDPESGLKQLARLVKSGGKVACCVYEKGSFYDYPSVRAYRKGVARLRSLVGIKLATRLALWYAVFAATVLHYLFWLPRRTPVLRRFIRYLGKYVVVELPLKDLKWRILDIFDAITPTFASTHTGDEIRRWFEASECTEIVQTNWGGTSFVAVKR